MTLRKTLFLIPILSLTACTTPAQRCAQAGFQPGTRAFESCALMEQQRSQAMMQQGLGLMSASTPQQRQSLNCNTDYHRGGSSTTCY